MNGYLNKQIKIREKNLKYDFLPSMIEIIERPSNKLGTIILLLIFTMIISAILWAALFKIDIAVTAMGTSMPKDGVATLNCVNGGRIQEICVEDGTYVEKDDVILILEAKEAELNLSRCRYELDVLKIQREVYGIVYESLIDEETDAIQNLDSQDYGEYASIAEAIILENELFLLDWEDLENGEEKNNVKQKQILAVLQNLNTLDAKIVNAKLSLENAEIELGKYVITAPIDGKITQMNSVYEGLLLASGDTVGYMLPEEREDIFTAYVANKDVSQIKIGDSVGIKLAAYDTTEYEYMEGVVVSIGDIALNMENLGTVYMVEICVPNLPEDIKVGMEGNCNIIIGQRSVLDYFLEPFKDGISGSLKER